MHGTTRRYVDTPAAAGAAAALLFAAAACTDEPDGNAAHAGLDIADVEACELLAPDAIEAATGIAVDAGRKVSPPGGLPMCNWPRAGSDVDIVLTLLVTPSRYDDYDEYLVALTEGPFGSADAADGVERVAGAGKFGAWLPEATMLQAYDEGVMVQVDLSVAGGVDALAAAQALAGQALAALR